MTKAQIVTILIFLKEPAVQVDAARLVAERTADQQTRGNVAALLRDLVSEISRLELLRQHAG